VELAHDAANVTRNQFVEYSLCTLLLGSRQLHRRKRKQPARVKGAVQSSPVVGLRRRLQLRFDFDLTALRPFDDPRYDRGPTYSRLLHCGLNKKINQRDCG